MVLIALVFAPKLASMDAVKGKFCAVNAKCGFAKIYELCLGFSNSNLSSHTFIFILDNTYDVIDFDSP